LRRKINKITASRDDRKKQRRVLWYPTQAKTGLEWGTQPSLPVKQAVNEADLNDGQLGRF
jgi:hypothetical protein